MFFIPLSVRYEPNSGIWGFMMKLSNRAQSLALGAIAMCAVAAIALTFVNVSRLFSSDKTYYLVDFMQSDRCDILNERGEFLATFPLGYCQFMPNGTVVGGLKKVRRLNANGEVVWQMDIVPDHHLHVEPNDNTLWVHHFEFEVENGKNVGSGVISQFDLDGKQLFRWSVKDHLAELSEKVSHFHLSYRPISHMNLVEYTHMRINSLHIIGENSNPKGLPFLKPGNLVIGCWETTQIFIVDRDSSKIVWNISLRNENILGPHTPYVDKRGDVVFFINDVDINDAEDDSAAIGVIDVQTKGITKHKINLEPWEVQFKSGLQGSVYPDGEGYIATASPKNIATRLNSDFTVNWKRRNIFSKNQPYRVRPVQASVVEHFLKQQL